MLGSSRLVMLFGGAVVMFGGRRLVIGRRRRCGWSGFVLLGGHRFVMLFGRRRVIRANPSGSQNHPDGRKDDDHPKTLPHGRVGSLSSPNRSIANLVGPHCGNEMAARKPTKRNAS
jgi:hypothetical protein